MIDWVIVALIVLLHIWGFALYKIADTTKKEKESLKRFSLVFFPVVLSAALLTLFFTGLAYWIIGLLLLERLLWGFALWRAGSELTSKDSFRWSLFIFYFGAIGGIIYMVGGLR
jgi:hypothetical protein